MMKNLKELTWEELCQEKSHAEQVGTPWDVYLLDINEEMQARKQTSEPITVSYTRNATAEIYPDKVRFFKNERGTAYRDLSIQEVSQDNHLLSFYRSEYLSNGIKARVMMKLQ